MDSSDPRTTNEDKTTAATLTILLLKPGTKVQFRGEKQRYTIRCIGKRYAVCTKPMNAQRTLLYTVINFLEGVRGTENLVFGLGAETDEDCMAMLARLENPDKMQRMSTEVSHRNRVPLFITAISND